MSDILDELDAKAEKATAHPVDVLTMFGPRPEMEFVRAVTDAYPQLAARLRAAEAALNAGLEYAAEVHNRGEDDDETCDALMRFDEKTSAWRSVREKGGGG